MRGGQVEVELVALCLRIFFPNAFANNEPAQWRYRSNPSTEGVTSTRAAAETAETAGHCPGPRAIAPTFL